MRVVGIAQPLKIAWVVGLGVGERDVITDSARPPIHRSLWVGTDDQDGRIVAPQYLVDDRSEVDGDRGLADAALLAAHSVNSGQDGHLSVDFTARNRGATSDKSCQMMPSARLRSDAIPRRVASGSRTTATV
ncbi:hypothetical protein Ae706Ps2_6100c [Pseudonocardia sp. Ae706_Ps2]|nr:hypothetical protein Ae706Ps2_6100c [Pseudonocardia sp. Ae706_Ps2]